MCAEYSLEPVHVLAVVTQMNSGGLENRLMDVIRNINREKIRIDIFTCRRDKGVFDEEAGRYGSRIYYNPKLEVKNMFWYVDYFSRFLREHPQYRIIHAHQNAWCSVFCKGAYKAGIPVRIAQSETAVGKWTVKNAVKNIIKIPARKYATDYFAVSEKAGSWLFGKRNMESGKVRILENAVDCSQFAYRQEKREQMRTAFHVEDRHVVMHVGNFTMPKNHPFIIEAFEWLAEKDRRALLVLVGDGEGKERMQRLVGKKHLTEKVLFLGSRSDVCDLLQMADVFFFPSLYEGLPGAVVEAQAAGLPCVISDSIAEEVCILDSTKQIPLDAEMDEWIAALQQAFQMKRRDVCGQVQEAGFDIHELVQKLEQFYTERGKADELI